MSIFRKSSVGSFTRGGQTTLHYVRMIVQVIRQFAVYMSILSVVVFTAMLYFKTTPYERSVAVDYGLAHFAIFLHSEPDHKMIFTLEDGKKINVRPAAIIMNEGVNDIMDRIFREMTFSIIASIAVSFGFMIWAIRFITTTGEDQADEQHIRGGTLAPATELSQLVQEQDKVGTISIGGVRLPAASEPAGILLCGGPGTGKSQIFLNMMREIRKANQRAIVYDVAGSFVEAFYDPKRDIILNPLDKRSKPWNLWADAELTWEYDAIAESIIPDSAKGNDPMWALAARKVFVEIAKQLKREDRTTNAALTSAILKITKEELIEFLKNTDAGGLLDKDAIKVLTSVRIMLIAYTQAFSYLHDAGTPFSIRKWVGDETQKGWIFVSVKANQIAATRPLITAWMDIAASAMLSIPENVNRRIWLSLDELPTLNKLPSLLNTMTNARKYGGCTIIGFQNYPQMRSIYDGDGADAITEACSTWGVLRANGAATGEWGSKGLGKTEVNETSEGLSYGAHEMRDGVNLTINRRTREIVMSTELTNLRDLHGYLRLGRGYPVGTFSLTYTKYKKVAQDFVLRAGAGEIDHDTNVDYETGEVLNSAFTQSGRHQELDDTRSALLDRNSDISAESNSSPPESVIPDKAQQPSKTRTSQHEDLFTSI